MKKTTIADLQQQKDQAEADARNAERLHANYKSRQRYAVRDARSKADQLEETSVKEISIEQARQHG